MHGFAFIGSGYDHATTCGRCSGDCTLRAGVGTRDTRDTRTINRHCCVDRGVGGRRRGRGRDGVVSGSPSQATVVTAVGSSTVPVGVPMSSAGLRRIGPGSPPPVVDDVAQFSFDGSGTQTQTVSSNFAQPLPVTVTPTYELDGEPTTPDELRGPCPIGSDGAAC